jgi:hypothetical protein
LLSDASIQQHCSCLWLSFLLLRQITLLCCTILAQSTLLYSCWPCPC